MIPCITVSGSPLDLGHEHGKRAKEAINRNFQFYLNLWNYFSGVERDQVLNDAKEFIPYIEKLDPELIEELRGVAAGSGMQFEEIVTLNARWELNYAYMPTPGTPIASEGCTAYALTPDATKNQHTLVGQNWDYKPGLKDSCIVLRIKREKKPNIIIHTEAGIIGHKGLNSAGIGVCLNFIRSANDAFQPGVPVWIKVRSILNSENLGDCVKMLMTFKGPNSANMIIAHRDGEAIDVECTPHDTLLLYPKEGILTHTNHFLSPELHVKDTGKSLLSDTLVRNQRAFQLLQNRKGEVQLETIKEVLTDHLGHPNSICRHRDQRMNPNEQWETLTSMMVDLTDGIMSYTAGPPCTNTYEHISMDKNM
jgi:isopenicillin-N N-acyltransferase-like protein